MAHKRKISVVGLGYVGLPVAIAFGATGDRVIAFDNDARRIEELRNGRDRTNEVTLEKLTRANLHLTTDANDLLEADFHIVTVPTPVDDKNRPDLTFLQKATETLGLILKPGDIVVYESTVYPGATRNVCVPILERISGLSLGKDFFVGYSPERINPGDLERRFETILKVVSGSDEETLEVIAQVYESVVMAGVHRAPDIETAEAAKVIENTQRDLNIALMNELAIIFDKLGIDTHDVLVAAGTKWNFLPFVPGLVGGHCIGVDPYYLTSRAEEIGCYPEVIIAGRKTNDSMDNFVVDRIAEKLLADGKSPSDLLVTVLGVTFKENIPDMRNSRVLGVVGKLKSLGFGLQIHDPFADRGEAVGTWGIELLDFDYLKKGDAVALCVAHDLYRDGGWGLVKSLLVEERGVVADIKGFLDRRETPEGIDLWRL